MTSAATNSSLFSKTLAQLRELARGLGVRSYAGLAKEDLVEALVQVHPDALVQAEPA